MLEQRCRKELCLLSDVSFHELTSFDSSKQTLHHVQKEQEIQDQDQPRCVGFVIHGTSLIITL